MRFEPVFVADKKLKTQFCIKHYKKELGTIEYRVYGRYLILIFLGLKPEYRRMGYGEQVVQYLMRRYPSKTIVGEALPGSGKFWLTMLKKYHGQGIRCCFSTNTSWSFILPKKEKMSHEKILNLLQIGYETPDFC